MPLSFTVAIPDGLGYNEASDVAISLEDITKVTHNFKNDEISCEYESHPGHYTEPIKQVEYALIGALAMKELMNDDD